MTTVDEQLAHTSIELGHLYMEDFAEGPDRLRDHFANVAPWATTIQPTGSTSTCFMIDDYFARLSSPAVLIPRLLAAATDIGLRIDYLARESACAQYGDVPLAGQVASRLTAAPDDFRPPATETGWLPSGQQPATEAGEAMYSAKGVRVDTDDGVFVDIELWRDGNGERKFSCAYLAAIWQMMRLGLLRQEGENVGRPQRVQDFPDRWDELPPLIQLTEDAAPFCATRNFSVLPARFLQVEQAVQIILDQLGHSAGLTSRIEYVLFGED